MEISTLEPGPHHTRDADSEISLVVVGPLDSTFWHRHRRLSNRTPYYRSGQAIPTRYPLHASRDNTVQAVRSREDEQSLSAPWGWVLEQFHSADDGRDGHRHPPTANYHSPSSFNSPMENADVE